MVELACKVSEYVCEEPGCHSAGEGLHAEVVASCVKSTHEMWGATMQSLSVRAHLLHDDGAFLYACCSRFNLRRGEACCQCSANLCLLPRKLAFVACASCPGFQDKLALQILQMMAANSPISASLPHNWGPFAASTLHPAVGCRTMLQELVEDGHCMIFLEQCHSVHVG